MKQRILEASKRLGLTHIGSNLSVLPVLQEIYGKKKTGDRVLLDGAHAHLAHLWVQVEAGEFDFVRRDGPDEVIEKYGIHCDRQAGCDASGGSLGHALGIGIGYALADKDKDVYVTVTDGGMGEGSNWEALRISSDMNIDNLKIYCNFNGYTAVAEIDRDKLVGRMKAFRDDIEVRYTENGEGFEGLQGHYRLLI